MAVSKIQTPSIAYSQRTQTLSNSVNRYWFGQTDAEGNNNVIYMRFPFPLSQNSNGSVGTINITSLEITACGKNGRINQSRWDVTSYIDTAALSASTNCITVVLKGSFSSLTNWLGTLTPLTGNAWLSGTYTL